MIDFTCERCGKGVSTPEVPRRGPICFSCHVRTVNIGFTHGKDDFHGDTIRQRQEKQIADAKSAGLDPQPIGQRWV